MERKLTIICYGDSNTFGYNSKDSSRYDESIRWTDVLQNKLGAGYRVINEGMCNRTGFVDNPEGLLFSAQKHFPKMLSEIDNIDILILAIGTNDLQFQYDISIETMEKGLENLIKLAQQKLRDIIIIPPVILNKNILKGFFSSMFDETSIIKSKETGKIFKQIANKNGCKYFDINEFATPSDFDGLHYDEFSHKLIAEKLFVLIR
jgi:lysophospholipase L1-like esterase